MTELKTQALNKMLEEMNIKHSPAVDQIHNWICEQDDESLFTNILKAGKTIANGLQYAAGKARALTQGSVICATDDQVYQWIVEYFASDAKEVTPVARVQSTQSDNFKLSSDYKFGSGENAKKYAPPITIKKPDPIKEAPQLSIFDLLNEPEPVKNHMSEKQAEVIAEIKAEAKANAWEDDIMPDDLDDEVTEDAADE